MSDEHQKRKLAISDFTRNKRHEYAFSGIYLFLYSIADLLSSNEYLAIFERLKMIDLRIPAILNRRRFIHEYGLDGYEIVCHTNTHETMRYSLYIQKGKKKICFSGSKDVFRKFANNLLNDIAELEAENKKG